MPSPCCLRARSNGGCTRRPPPIAVPLSGGHDSRHIVLALHALGRPPDRCVTVEPYPPSAGDDVRLARLVADAVGVPHVVIPQRRDRIAAESEKNRLTNFCADEHAQFLPLRDYFASHRCTVFDGLAGDVLSQSQRLDPQLHRHVRGRPSSRGRRGDPRRSGRGRRCARRAADASTRSAASDANGRWRASSRKPDGTPARRIPIASFFAFTRMRRGGRARAVRAPRRHVGGVAAVSRGGPGDAPPVAALRAGRRPAAAHRSARAPLPVVRASANRCEAAGPRGSTPCPPRRAGAAPGDHREAERADLARAAVAARAARALATGRSAHLWFLPKVMHLLDVEALVNEVVAQTAE